MPRHNDQPFFEPAVHTPQEVLRLQSRTSCTYDRHFPSLAKTEGFFGFDAFPEYNDIHKVEAALAGRGVWIQRLGDMPRIAHGATGRRDDLPLIRQLRGKVGMFVGVHGDNRQDAMDRAKRLLDALNV